VLDALPRMAAESFLEENAFFDEAETRPTEALYARFKKAF
jgi:hypothetical protein